MDKKGSSVSFWISRAAPLAVPLLLKAGLHAASFWRYGYFRDELYYIACSDHLALGYVDQPPLSIFLLKIVRLVLGDSLFAIVAGGALSIPIAVPILPLNAYLAYQDFLGFKPPQEERSGLGVLPQHYADMFGWPEMAKTVSGIYERLSPEEKAVCMIYTRNYGEAGAIDFFGRAYGLPKAVSGHNNYWLWGFGEWKGTVAIVWGDSRDAAASRKDLEAAFEKVELAATTSSPFAMPYENRRAIFLCRGIKAPFKDIWPREKNFN